jgi:hypothetical protein
MTIAASRINGNTAQVSGGGIYRAPLPMATPADSISTTTLSGNTAGLRGGGMHSSTNGSLSLLRTTVDTNSAGSGAAGVGGGLDLMAASNAGTAGYLIENSTIDDNTASASGATGGAGGGVHLTADLNSTAPDLTIRSATISDNTAAPGTGTGAGGNLRVDATLPDSLLAIVRGSIVSGGSGSAGQRNCSSDFVGSFLSTGGNVESLDECSFADVSDKVNTNPGLGLLQDNGGPTKTRAITAASPAFDIVSTADCPPPGLDQVGTTRPQGGACDSGAFELIPAPPPPPPDMTPMTPPPTTPVTPPAPRKKCKKGQKLKRGKCVKKRKKRKRS